MQDEKDIVTTNPDVERVSSARNHEGDIKAAVADKIHQEHPEFYLEAIATYPDDEHIDSEAEKRLKRKLDWRILPLLGVCYFFYVFSPSLSQAHSLLRQLTSMTVRRQNHTILCRYLRHRGLFALERQTIQLAFQYFLLRMAVLGDSVQPDHATKPTGLVSRR